MSVWGLVVRARGFVRARAVPLVGLVGCLLVVVLVAPVAWAGKRVISAARAPIRVVHTTWGQIGYRVVGRGSPLLLLTGAGFSIDLWPPSFIDALARHHRVYVLDYEGVGRSTLRPGTLTVPRMADDAADFISVLRLDRPDVMGLSMGGSVAQALGVRHSRSVRRLILASSAAGIGQFVPGSPFPVGDPLALGFPSLFPPDQRAAGQAYVRDIQRYRAFYEGGPPATTAAQGAANIRWVQGKDAAGYRVSRLRGRVLIGAGDADTVSPVVNSRILARMIPQAKLKIYPDASHGFLFQDSRDWIARVDRFLS